MSIVIVGYIDTLWPLYALKKNFHVLFAMILVQVHNRPTTECQFLSVGKLKRSTGRENHTLTSSARFALELAGIQSSMLFRQPGLPRRNPLMAACIKLICNFL